MLVLNSSDIKKSVSILDMLNAVENAFLLQETDSYLMPDRIHVEHNEHVHLLMPAYKNDFFSTKLVSVYPENTSINEPIINGSVILSDGKTGKPVALMDGSMLTALRTGAIGGLGIAFTSPKNATTIGLIGAGFQGFHQILFACTVRNIKTVYVFDSLKNDLNPFINQLKELLPHLELIIANDADEVVMNSEIIITATTSETPVMPNDINLLERKHFIGLGSFKPEMQEFPDQLFGLLDKVIIDTDLAKKESGDIRAPLEDGLINQSQLFRLGQLINNEISIDYSKTTLFKSVGMALFDLLSAEIIYKKAQEKGIGTKVEF